MGRNRFTMGIIAQCCFSTIWQNGGGWLRKFQNQWVLFVFQWVKFVLGLAFLQKSMGGFRIIMGKIRISMGSTFLGVF